MDYFSITLSILKSLAFKDIIDISLLSFFLSIFIYIIIKTQNFNLLGGVLVFLSAYFASWIFNLKLLKGFFDYFSGILILILVIVFAKEIRIFLEKLGILFNQSRKFKLVAKNSFIEEIIEALNYLAKNKIGALIVFQNKVNLENFISHQLEINSLIKKELLVSIFNKNSPLHDGAVILENDKIKYVSAHLPLAENYKFKQKLGTRHRAGVGITEKTDALSLIVSEENGKISLAKEGKIYYDLSLEKIKEELLNFYQLLENKNGFRGILSFLDFKKIRKMFLIYILSFFLILSYWVSLNFNRSTIQKTIEAGIEFKNLNEGLIVSKLNPSKVKISLRGRDTDFNNLKENSVKVVIDLRDSSEGNYFLSLNKKDVVGLKDELEIIKFEPERISFKIEKFKNENKLEK
ncbi:Cyclic di-AMP synthase CdaA [bacterium HR35]|nr:Cyclic di-AMP synthase CdaA [bacterium HR35]